MDLSDRLIAALVLAVAILGGLLSSAWAEHETGPQWSEGDDETLCDDAEHWRHQ